MRAKPGEKNTGKDRGPRPKRDSGNENTRERIKLPQQGPKDTGTQELGQQFHKITRSLGQYKAAILQCPHRTSLTVPQSLLGRGQLLLLLMHLLRAYIVQAHLIISGSQAK